MANLLTPWFVDAIVKKKKKNAPFVQVIEVRKDDSGGSATSAVVSDKKHFVDCYLAASSVEEFNREHPGVQLIGAMIDLLDYDLKIANSEGVVHVYVDVRRFSYAGAQGENTFGDPVSLNKDPQVRSTIQTLNHVPSGTTVQIADSDLMKVALLSALEATSIANTPEESDALITLSQMEILNQDASSDNSILSQIILNTENTLNTTQQEKVTLYAESEVQFEDMETKDGDSSIGSPIGKDNRTSPIIGSPNLNTVTPRKDPGSPFIGGNAPIDNNTYVKSPPFELHQYQSLPTSIESQENTVELPPVRNTTTDIIPPDLHTQIPSVENSQLPTTELESRRYVICIEKPYDKKKKLFTRLPVQLGSSEGCSIQYRPNASHVKPVHLEIAHVEGNVVATPVEAGKVWINGRLIQEPTTLSVNDKIQIAQQTPPDITYLGPADPSLNDDTVEEKSTIYFSPVQNGDTSPANADSLQVILTTSDTSGRKLAIIKTIQPSTQLGSPFSILPSFPDLMQELPESSQSTNTSVHNRDEAQNKEVTSELNNQQITNKNLESVIIDKLKETSQISDIEISDIEISEIERVTLVQELTLRAETGNIELMEPLTQPNEGKKLENQRLRDKDDRDTVIGKDLENRSDSKSKWPFEKYTKNLAKKWKLALATDPIGDSDRQTEGRSQEKAQEARGQKRKAEQKFESQKKSKVSHQQETPVNQQKKQKPDQQSDTQKKPAQPNQHKTPSRRSSFLSDYIKSLPPQSPFSWANQRQISTIGSTKSTV